jgi:hypothetical protein
MEDLGQLNLVANGFLVMSVMNEKAMWAFRKQYRSTISRRYFAWLHMLSVAVVGLTAISYALAQLEQPDGSDYLVLLISVLMVNFAEYCAHRWLGHRKTKIGKLFYQRHSGDHHSFFLEGAMGYESNRDWRVVLFPVYLIFAFILGLALPGAYILHQLFGINAAAFYVVGTLGGYLLYELMHFSYHLPGGHWLEKLFGYVPGWRTLQNSHRLHHRRDRMHNSNFNITLPVFDLLLGTLDYSEDQ